MELVRRNGFRVFFVVAFLSTGLTGIERECLAQAIDEQTSTEPETEPVFPPPSEYELSKITHPELRAELLRMVYEDQAARRAGT